MSIAWLGLSEVADLAGVSTQRLRFLVGQGGSNGPVWRGADLKVRCVAGRGGLAGQQYQVRVDSLPADLQQRWKELHRPVEGRLKHGQKAAIDRDWWHSLIMPVLATAKHSAERAATLRELASKPHMRPDGTWLPVSVRSMQRKVDAYERTGSIAVLGRTKRVDAGERRVIVSTRWDKAVPFDPDTKAMIARDLIQHVRGLIIAGEHGAMLKALAAKKLADLTRAFGHSSDLDRICAIPDCLIGRERSFRTVATFKRDRKAFEDTVRPRVRRTRDGMLPMQMVVGDVHPIDIVCSRPDGSTVHPKAIGWLDVATNRLHLDILFMEPGKGVRNEDVIRSFMRMTHRWGLATSLYLDNGSEYNWAEFIDDALQLVSRTGAPDASVGYMDQRASAIIRAQPYNAAAKPIEGIFGLLEQRHLSSIPGWVGGDRMRKKTANVGRAVEPFQGSHDDLRGLIEGLLHIYHNQPQKRGDLKGLSPNGALRAAIEAGWKRTAVDETAFAFAFSRRETRKLHQGAFRHAGQSWTCDELTGHLDDTVTVLIPKYQADVPAMLVEDRKGRLLGIAAPDRTYAYADPAGAQEARRRVSKSVRAVKSAARSVPVVDPLAERMQLAASYAPELDAPIGGVVSGTERAMEAVRKLQQTPAERSDDSYRKNQEKGARNRARVAKLNALILGDKT